MKEIIMVCPVCMWMDRKFIGICDRCEAETEVYKVFTEEDAAPEEPKKVPFAPCSCGPNEKCDNCPPRKEELDRDQAMEALKESIDLAKKQLDLEALLIKSIDALTEQLKNQPVCVPYYPFPYLPPSVPEWPDYPSTSGGQGYTITYSGSSGEPVGKWVLIKTPKKNDDGAGQACKA